ncbi:uncharacterized protein LOC129720970 [Wyeomyia smithii]|uniref:uncharacterized protein LOC129720970 n=1 Tax=Wyeomyia smithii TaxID=174621 RepID=UPI002467AD65|nr:uncharacterized protein LOC129720970 [Wyeomyia smithii]
MDRKLLLYVENVSPSGNEENFISYLQKWAPVLDVYFLKEKQCTKRSLAAFIRVASEADLQQILDRNQQNYRGKRLFMLRADQPQYFQADETIIVRNINQKMSEETLYDHFEECGPITHVQVRTDDFAYIGFQDKVGAKNAMAKNNMPLKNSNLKIQLLTRNVEIMIVDLNTLQNKMPQLYRKLCMPVQPRPAAVKQQQSDYAQEEPQKVEEMQQQVDQRPQVVQQQQQNRNKQQQQQKQNQQQQSNQQQNRQQQQQQQQPNQQPQQQKNQPAQQSQPNRQQQQQQQQQQNWQKQPQQNRQQQQQQNRQQQQQQNRPQQQQQNRQQQEQQNRQQPQQQQNRQQPQQQQNRQQPQQQNRQQQQNQQQQQQQNRQQPQQQNHQQQQQNNQGHQGNKQQSNQPKPNVWQKQNPFNQEPLPQRAQPSKPQTEEVLPALSPAPPVNDSNVAKPSEEEPDVIVLDPPQAEQPTVEDDVDLDVQFVAEHNPDLPPIPSEYQAKPDDVMRCVKASEIKMIPAEVKDLADKCAVWVNNIPSETRRIELIEYMEQFGSVLNCKIKPSTCSFFTKWAKITFISEQVAEKAAEYFLHPFQGRYLFVLSCKKCVEETSERTFVIDYLSKYTTYEEVAAAFKPVGEVFYLVRLYGNSFKSRIFFVNDVNKEDVLAVKSVNGIPINVEPFTKGMGLKNTKAKLKELIATREKVDAEKTARLEKINEITQLDAGAPCIPRLYTNTDPERHPVEVIVQNVPKGTSNEQITRIFASIGKPISIRREPEPHDKTVERIFVGFLTLSKALKAADISPETTFAGHNLFIYTAWTTAQKSANNTLMLKMASAVTIQAVYNEMSRFGRVRYVQMDDDKQATVIFFGLESGPVVSARSATTIGDVKIISKVRLDGPSTIIKSDGPIVIDDEVEIVAVEPAGSVKKSAPNASAKGNKPPQQQSNKEQRQPKQQQTNQHQARQQQQQQQKGPQKSSNAGGSQNMRPKLRNPFSEQQQRPSRRDGPNQQQVNPWNVPDYRMDDPPLQQRNEHNPWQNQRMQQDHRDRFDYERAQFERGIMPLMDDDFNRSRMDDPPLDRWNEPQYSNQFSPPRQRSPFEQNYHGWNDGGRGGESPLNIPPNIADDDIDTYIMQKQLAIERRLEQLDKQLTVSGDSRRGRNSDDMRRRRDDIVFSDNGDVHYVPNPAARFRDSRRVNRNRQNGRGRLVPMASRRTHDPFDDIEVTTINVPNSNDRSPSPKRMRNYQEDDFDAERFNAAWC